MIKIRKGKISDFPSLNQEWAWSNENWQREAQKKTIRGIQKGDQEFYVVELDNGDLIGELHIYWKQEDTDEADGKNRAYLSALRIHPEYRGKGLGTKLVKHCLQGITKNGFSEATIGAYEKEQRTQDLYKKWGFTEFVKEKYEETEEYKEKYFLYLYSIVRINSNVFPMIRGN